MANPAPHERLNDALEARRLDSGWSWKQLAAEAGISAEALAAIRRGANRPSPLTKRQIEDALQWAHGSIDAILDGGDPTPADAPADPPPGDDLELRLKKARELLAQAQELLDEAGYRREDRGGRAS